MSQVINGIVFTDNSYGTLASGLLVTDTALTFTTGHGARFPAVTGTQVLYCCILNSTNVIEEITITAHVSGADTATITRGAGGTSAKAWNAGDRIEARFSTTSLYSALGNTLYSTGTQTLTGDLTVTGTGTLAVGVVGTGTATLLTVPTQAAADNSTKAASTAYADKLGTTILATQATTSGTSKDFTIPSGAKKIIVMFSGVSTNGTSPMIIQLGDAGGVETSGYLSAAGDSGAGTTSTAGFIVTRTIGATDLNYGQIILNLIDSATFAWTSGGTLYQTNIASNTTSSGYKATSQEVSTVRITMVNGTDAFDAGLLGCSWSQ